MLKKRTNIEGRKWLGKKKKPMKAENGEKKRGGGAVEWKKGG